MAKKKTPAIPTVRHTIVTLRSEPPQIAQSMSVERVHAVIRAAEAGDVRDLFALYRDVIASDSHLQAELQKRKLAVLGDRMTILPWDSGDPADVAAAEAVENMIQTCPAWKKACIHLLDSVIWPVAVVEKVFNPSGSGFTLADLVPVSHCLLDYRSGEIRISDVDPSNGAILSTSQAVDPERYIVHRGHMLTVPDTWGGPMRSILFWWLLSTMSREWWARFLDRYGSPFIVGKYPAGDENSRNTLRNALALAVKIGGLVLQDACEAQLVQAASSTSGDAYERFLTICQREKSKLVLGQTLSAEAQATGLGSSVASVQEEVRQDIRQWDAASLADTFRSQLFEQFLRINGLPGNPPTIVWGSPSQAELKARADLLVALKTAGLRPTDNAIAVLSEDLGIEIEREPSAAQEVGGLLPFSAPTRRPLAARAQAALHAQTRIDDLARRHAADVAQTLGEVLAPFAHALKAARSPDDLPVLLAP